jgi:hypothetical protein
MKNLLIFSVLFIFSKFSFAQPGVASIEPANLIKDAVDRTLTMKNGAVTNAPVVSHWQLHATGFQPTISMAAGGFYMESVEHPEFSYVTMTLTAANGSMMAPIDLPDNSEIRYFEACYMDKSGTSPNYANCGLKFTFYRVFENGCPPEALGSILSTNGGDINCPFKCTQFPAPVSPIYTVNNKDYFYYVVVNSYDTQATGQQCGNWAQANLGVRGIEIEYARK